VCCGLRLAVDLSVKTFRRCLLADAVGYISGELEAAITTFGSRPSDHYFRSVCLSVCLCRVFLSRL